MEKESIRAVTDNAGYFNKLIPLRGFVEKIEIVYFSEEVNNLLDLIISFVSSENEKILEITGTNNAVYRPRTSLHDFAGNVITFDGSNSVPEKFYVHDFVEVSVKSPVANFVVEAINVYYESTELVYEPQYFEE